jgi:hypothetical protein
MNYLYLNLLKFFTNFSPDIYPATPFKQRIF